MDVTHRAVRGHILTTRLVDVQPEQRDLDETRSRDRPTTPNSIRRSLGAETAARAAFRLRPRRPKAVTTLAVSPTPAQRYSFASLLRHALAGHRDWRPARAPRRTEGGLRRRYRRRRRSRPRSRLLSRRGARSAQRGGGGEGLARRRQHRAQHDDRPVQLSAARERCVLRIFAQAVGRPHPEAELQSDVQSARFAEPRP